MHFFAKFSGILNIFITFIDSDELPKNYLIVFFMVISLNFVFFYLNEGWVSICRLIQKMLFKKELQNISKLRNSMQNSVI